MGLILLGSMFGLGVWLTHRFYQKVEITEKENADVLLEKIKTVTKMITVEGYFSEIYDYEDYWGYDMGIFKKKALLRVKAKVSAGYDLSGMAIKAYSKDKKIVISNIPDPEILSIDHDIDYYDLQEGIFNSFTAEDYSKLQANAKEFIQQKAEESDLFLAAEEQSGQMMEMIQFIVENAGWTLEFKTRYQELITQDTLKH